MGLSRLHGTAVLCVGLALGACSELEAPLETPSNPPATVPDEPGEPASPPPAQPAAPAPSPPAAPPPSPAPPSPPGPAPSAAAIVLVSGDGQEGKAGEPLGAPLVVQVKDADGHGVENARVLWSVTSGGGMLRGKNTDGYLVPVTASSTGLNGLAQVTFEPSALGTSTVAASLEGSSASVTFTSHASVLVIENSFWGYFLAPDGTREAIVPVGTTVEWANPYHIWANYPWEVRWRVWSTSTPAGGASFDSGVLAKTGRFQFVPAVTGTWHWTWTYLDGNGQVTGAGDLRRVTAR